ncbi:hypothetical protein FPV67DRAFT_1472562 [Lyophyllum atratum]|nr:hypothetical protein FPV67DRAFT_1472562 [Lyophyllum atratum]
MKLSALSLGLLALASTSVNAQYFSAGWKPGQPQETPSSPAPIPQKQKEATPDRLSPSKLASYLDITTLLSTGPVVSLFERLGINITERLADATERAKVWDDRVTLIRDDNFQELIVDEPLTQQEEQDRTWILVISVTAGRQDGISKYVDQVFDSAFNESVIAGDLPNVRWGRIDYFNVTYITTKWAIWHAPYLVIAKDRGRSLRFYRPHQLRLKQDALLSFLQNEDWKVTPPWSSSFSPGGDWESIMHYLALALMKIYNTAVLIPRWLLFIISGSIASVVLNFLHRPSAAPARLPPPPVQQQQSNANDVPSPSVEAESSATSSSSKANKRKKGKGKN